VRGVFLLLRLLGLTVLVELIQQLTHLDRSQESYQTDQHSIVKDHRFATISLQNVTSRARKTVTVVSSRTRIAPLQASALAQIIFRIKVGSRPTAQATIRRSIHSIPVSVFGAAGQASVAAFDAGEGAANAVAD
jgi:hypothetical protein